MKLAIGFATVSVKETNRHLDLDMMRKAFLAVKSAEGFHKRWKRELANQMAGMVWEVSITLGDALYYEVYSTKPGLREIKATLANFKKAAA